MEIALMILFVILFLFAIIYPREIYPSRVKKRIKAHYDEIDISNYEEHIFRVRAGAYFDCIFDTLLTGFFFMVGFTQLIMPVSLVEKNILYMIVLVFGTILFGTLTAFLLIRVVYFFPRRCLVYRNRTVYYREGSKERTIDKITSISYNRNSKTNYFTLRIKIPGEENPLKLDFMSFGKPEVVYKIMLSKLSGDSKREAVLKRVTRR